MTEKAQARLRRQGRALVFAVPPPVQRELALKPGDYLSVWAEDGWMQAFKVDLTAQARKRREVSRDGNREQTA
jgi:hypothetical protein